VSSPAALDETDTAVANVQAGNRDRYRAIIEALRAAGHTARR
jgi:hypothetical protein